MMHTNFDDLIEAALAAMSLQQFFLSAAIACEKRGLGTIADHCKRIAAQLLRMEGRKTKTRKPRRARS
jgi:hypothetical protein